MSILRVTSVYDAQVIGPDTHRQFLSRSSGARTAQPRRLLRHLAQDRCLARLDLGVRRVALIRGCPLVWVWLSFGLRPVGCRDEAWLKRGLPKLEVALPTSPFIIGSREGWVWWLR